MKQNLDKVNSYKKNISMLKVEGQKPKNQRPQTEGSTIEDPDQQLKIAEKLKTAEKLLVHTKLPGVDSIKGFETNHVDIVTQIDAPFPGEMNMENEI